MDQIGRKSPLSGTAFATSVLVAPGLAIAICVIGATLTAFSVGLHEIGNLFWSLLLLLVIVSIWGFLPSLFFGALVLTIILRFWPGRPHSLVFVAGGVAAAGLYVLTSLGVAEVLPGAAMLFAPWATPDVRGSNAAEDWWVLTSLLLAGAGAGLIYAVRVKRG